MDSVMLWLWTQLMLAALAGGTVLWAAAWLVETVIAFTDREK